MMDELVVSRVYEATPEQIWTVLTEPEHLHKFFAPAGSTVPLETVTMDVRVGGEFSLTMVNGLNGEEYPMQAEYIAIEEAKKLSFKTTGGIQGTIELEDMGDDRTLLTWTTVVDFDGNDEFRKGATVGTHSTVDNLRDLLATLYGSA